MSTLMNDDLGLDPSNPLNLLLHNHSQHNMQHSDDDSSPSIGTPPDWNLLSSMWPPEHKMDDIPSSPAWTSAWAWAWTPPTLASSIPSNSPLKPLRERRQHRLLLPPPSMRAASVDTRYSASTDDPAAELANCVRKNAGVVLAVQIGRGPRSRQASPLPCSKANVLGKAVECIHVLKNREKRLTRELEGLKTLLRGLVGGTELLGKWECEWVGMFGGGGEHDEVGVEDGANANEDDAEDDEEGESDDEGGAGRKRKNAKVEPALKVKVEKEERGRPCSSLSDCGHKPTIHVTLSVRDVHVVSVGWRGIGGKGKEDPPPSRHRRAPLHGGCVCRMRALHAALVPISLVFAFTLPPHAIPPVPRPPHAHTHVGCVCVESPRSSPSPFSPPFPPFPAAHARAVESSADCTKFDSAAVQCVCVVLLAGGDARAEFARMHCADVRPLCCIPAPSLSSLPSPFLPFRKRNGVLVGNLKGFKFEGFEI
ncbi:hypothetical protein B0H16DRAFT_1481482 [Mycena metata]|uniref:BHLH domain-containing protein n=1 Tax=Mycena metata TaxID=1033252 RepID=A0AAD7MA99_9AGAR|nr:hypothetical protein B0H16DRAFT_1481482 [Mycena metata]